MEWRLIPDIPYEASASGEIRHAVSHQYCPIKQFGLGGYKDVRLLLAGTSKWFSVHRLVCAAIHGLPPIGQPYAAHGDGDSTNNCADNLRWASPKENGQDTKRHGTCKGNLPPSRAKLSAEEVKDIRVFCHRTKRTLKGQLPKGVCRDLGKKYGCTSENISAINAGKSWIGVP